MILSAERRSVVSCVATVISIDGAVELCHEAASERMILSGLAGPQPLHLPKSTGTREAVLEPVAE